MKRVVDYRHRMKEQAYLDQLLLQLLVMFHVIFLFSVPDWVHEPVIFRIRFCLAQAPHDKLEFRFAGSFYKTSSFSPHLFPVPGPGTHKLILFNTATLLYGL